MIDVLAAIGSAMLAFYRWCLTLILVEIVAFSVVIGCWHIGDWIMNKIDWPRARGRRRRSERP